MKRAVVLRAAIAVVAALVLGLPAAGLVRADSPEVQIRHVYATGTAEGDGFAVVVGRAETLLPDITITLEEVAWPDFYAPFNGGDPDLVVGPGDAFGDQARAGAIADVTNLIAFRQPTLRHMATVASQVDGRAYLVPLSLKAVAFVYSRSRLPHPPLTTSGWLWAADHGARLGLYAGGLGVYYHYGLYSAFGGRILDSTGRCVADQNGGVAAALAWVRSAAEHGVTLYWNPADAQADLVAGNLDGYIDGNWAFGDLREAMGSDLGVVPGPVGPRGIFRALAGVDGFVINNLAEYPAAARAVALTMTDRGSQQLFVSSEPGFVPANQTVAIPDPRVRVYAAVTALGIPRPQSAEFGQYWASFGWTFDAVVFDGADPTAVVAEACSAMNTANGF